MRAAVMKFNLVGIVLLCLSGASPVAEVSGWDEYEGALAASCPQGSCEGRRG